MTQTRPLKTNLFNRNADLLHGPIFKNLLLFMLPILVSNLFQQLYNTVDTMIVGNVLGDTALAAIGSCGSIYELLVGFGIGIGNGLSIVAARSYGAQDEDLLKRTVAGSLVIGLCASFVITTAGFFGLRPLLQLLDTPAEILEDAYRYIIVIDLGVLVMFLYNLCAGLLRAIVWGLLSRGSESSREEYRRELEDTVQALRCHPCVGCWVPFNEGWGQYDAAGAVQATRALDDTRLVDEASGWYDQGGGDVYSLHNYFYPLRVRPQTRTVALSEYGGIAWPMPGHEPPRKTYGYGTAKSREELTARYKKMQLGAVLPQLQKGLSALVYTQLTDVEDEVNGLFTYDRTAIKPDANAVRSVNAALAAEFARVVK